MKWRSVVKRVLAPMLVLVLSWAMVSCSQSGSIARKSLLSRSGNRLAEIAPPSVIQELKQYTDIYQPQVTILSPRSDEVLEDTQTSVKLQVRDLPLFKDEEFELGYHLHFILDNQPYQAIFDVDEPIVLSDLEPGTHTIRVFASRPWHESFKNEGAFAETTFHIFAKTPENNPDPHQPLLTYSRPKGNYGAEPVLLDFYLTNAPLHFVAQENSEDAIPDWQIRCTINGESFTFDRWEPIYLQGLKPGRNWVQLELLDENGNPLPNAFNNTIHIVNYQPNGTDALSRLIRGEIPLTIARRLTDPNYTPPAPEPAAVEETLEEVTPAKTREPDQETLPEKTGNETTELQPQAIPNAFDRATEQTPVEIPAELEQPDDEESIREELADEVKEQLQNELEASPSEAAGKAKDDRSPLLIRPVEQSAPESAQPNAPDAAPQAKPPVLPSTPKQDDLPPTLPEIIEEPDIPTTPAPPPSRLPAPIPRFLTFLTR
ncbi:hypothetical protein NDI45_01930 [Leptolyngbya sp. GB1-A1]|uniref:hypothetical protein n=1 Tax=Leptolyngbya sp. GB1-A1 TaxID=2933908 RepID=UPI003297A43B